ncbi:MAG: DUF1638 domain-containing protein [Armatimonadota bacterium]
MRIKLIACEVFARELMAAAAASPHVVDLKLMPFGLHDTPEELRSALQDEIDSTVGAVSGSQDVANPENAELRFDFIALGYGLCSRGTSGLRARSIPIVIPRAHDCITLLLGSRSRYSEEFSRHPGTYYYSPGWIERKAGDVKQGFVDDAYARRNEERYREYVEKYGEDNARFLMEQESLWVANYTRAALIDTGLGDIDSYRRFTQNIATEHGWEYAEIRGDTSLLQRLASAEWDPADFLIVSPGRTVAESFDETVLKEA